METTFDYLRAHAIELGLRILRTFPPLQSTKDPVAPSLPSLLRKALPAQALAITGTAKYLRNANAARIVAECGAGKTFMALGTIHVLAEGRPSTTLVMCPSQITHEWARELLLTIPRARAFLIEDMRNGSDPGKQHGICEVKLSKGKTVYEGKRLSLAEMRRMGRKEWRKQLPTEESPQLRYGLLCSRNQRLHERYTDILRPDRSDQSTQPRSSRRRFQ
jgi:hypothetical protein